MAREVTSESVLAALKTLHSEVPEARDVRVLVVDGKLRVVKGESVLADRQSFSLVCAYLAGYRAGHLAGMREGVRVTRDRLDPTYDPQAGAE